jgi:hypothetical protein
MRATAKAAIDIVKRAYKVETKDCLLLILVLCLAVVTDLQANQAEHTERPQQWSIYENLDYGTHGHAEPDSFARCHVGFEVGNDLDSAYVDYLHLCGRESNVFSFLNFRGSTDIKFEDLTGDIGLVYRSSNNDGSVEGINVFYDITDTEQGSIFQQLGFGLEGLELNIGIPLDARFNYYLPLNNKESVKETATLKKYEVSLSGYDLEIGTLLPLFLDSLQQRLYVGLYSFSGDGKDTDGHKVRLEVFSDNGLIFDLAFRHDSLGGDQWLVGIVIPLGAISPSHLEGSPKRLADRIIRNWPVYTAKVVKRKEPEEGEP